MRVLVQGARLGGLTLAAGLAQRGQEVDVVEQRTDPVLGVGLNVPANALGALAEIGVRDAVVASGWPFEDLHLWDPTGRVVARIPPPASGYGLPSNVATPRPAYGRILREAAEAAGARIRTGATTSAVAQDADGVDVRIGDTEERYDLVVGFDGIRSTLRPHVSDAEPVFTGYAVWRATTERHPLVDRIVMAMAPARPDRDRRRRRPRQHPHLAQGGAMAVEDAVVLAGALTGGDPLPDALASWYARRRPRSGFVQDMSHALLHQESGAATTDAEDELLVLGMPGAMRRLAEPY